MAASTKAPKTSATTEHPNSQTGQTRRRIATLGEVESFAHGLPPEQLRCRAMGHKWEPHNAWKNGKEFIGRYRCSSCGSFRSQSIDRRGHIVSTDYEYAEGYTGGINSVSYEGRAILRWTNFARTFGEVSTDTRD